MTNQAAPSSQKAQSAGRGLVLITAAKLWFMVGGAALGLVLPRMFPKAVSAQRFGEWGTVLACISVLNNVIVTGTIQAVAKFAARGAHWIEGTKRVALRVNVVVVSLTALVFFLAAPWIAGFEKNPGIEAPLRLSTGVVLCYGLYAVFVGAANGAREFHKQAGLDMGFTTLRAGFVLAAAAIFATVTAAVAGFVSAAATILVVSIFVVGWGRVEERPAARELLAFAAPVAGYLLVQNLLMFVDLWLVERYVALAAEHAGTLALDATRVASKAVGAYNGALQVARLPYQVTIAVTFVIFPLVSQAAFTADHDRTREYIRKSVRLSFLVVIALAAAAAARPDKVFLLIFPGNGQGTNDYLPGAAALAPLMFAYAAFSLFSIAGTIINGAGATLAALTLGVTTLLLSVALNFLAINWALDTNHHPLQAAAIATAIAMTLGLCASLTYLQRRFGASLAPLSAARVLLAAALAVTAGHFIPLPGGTRLVSRALACVIAGAAAALVYVVVLFASREITTAELRALARRGR